MSLNASVVTPTISVVIPCYNGARYLAETLQSVLNQTLPVMEVIVVDDGSSDESANIASSFGKPVRVIQQANQGESVARNRGIEEARGDWIAFLDADDIWKEHKLRTQVDRLAEVGREVVCVHCGFYLFGARNQVGTRPDWADRTDFSPLELLMHPRINTSTAMVRRELAVRFPEWTRHGEDMLYFAELSTLGKIAYVDQPLVGYRCHSAQQHVRASHYIEHTKSRLQWLALHQDRFSAQERDQLSSTIKTQPLRRLKEFKQRRDWPQYWQLREFLCELIPTPRPKALDETVFPPFCYRLKDVVFAYRRTAVGWLSARSQTPDRQHG